MLRLHFFAVLISLTAAARVLPAQQIETSPDGNQIVKFTPGQQTAVDLFLKTHPNLIQANCANFELSAKDCAASYRDWQQIVKDAKAVPQSQYAVWGNYSHHSSADLVIPFFSKTAVNNWGWRRWQIVVFESIGENQYKPIVALTDSWGVCFDGILYHPVRKRVEFWCKSMGGNVSWNGTTFVGKLEKGD